MPRKRPGAVRAAQARARHAAVIPGLSPSTCRTLNRLDRDELRPDVVATALRRWQQAARDPGATAGSAPSATGPLFDQRDDWTEPDQPMCEVCARATTRQDEPRARDVLSRALYALPRGKARQLRLLVHEADRRVLDRTLPDPHRPRHVPWWSGRLLPR